MSKSAQSLFLNRELSVLAFNQRVLSQAELLHVPLLERLRFLCIVSSNLDEFFEIRVSGLIEKMRLHPKLPGIDGLKPKEVYEEICNVAHQLVEKQYQLLNRVLYPALAKEGIKVLGVHQWTEAQRNWAKNYFMQEILPVLTPIGLDPAHPFPRVLNKSLNFAVDLKGRDAYGRHAHIAIVQAPRLLPRVIQLPLELTDAPYTFTLLSNLIECFVGELFPGLQVQGCYQFRLTRNSDLYVDEEELINLRDALQGELSQRRFGDSVRLEIAKDCPNSLCHRLLCEFDLSDEAVYRVTGPVNLNRLNHVVDLVDRPDLKFLPFSYRPTCLTRDDKDFFNLLSKQDILLHQPYENFDVVLNFVKYAANDPNVVSIKQTIYRTGNQSVLMDTLLQAARRGKEVTVVVELMARFDEETNLYWANQLEEAGAHVVYGVVGYKTHAKMLLVVRRENIGGHLSLKRYAHLGTGNYHPRTARLYTDLGLFTSHTEICADVHEIFQQITGLGQAQRLQRLWQAPFTLQRKVVQAIKQEMQHAKAGKKAHIIAKMNALVEPETIQALYEASQAGVKIELIIRGVCALRPQVAGLSDNITVRSIIGRFLEHSRIFYFYNAGAQDLYLSSADWMERNFFKRIELAFPILDAALKQRIFDEVLTPQLSDNQLAWKLQADGTYTRIKNRKPALSSQEFALLRLAN